MARFASVVDRVTLGLRWHEVPSDDRHDDRGDLAQSQFGGVEQHLDAPTGEVEIGAQNVPAGSHGLASARRHIVDLFPVPGCCWSSVPLQHCVPADEGGVNRG